MVDASLIVFIGVLTTIVSVLTKLFGLPDQIRKNWLKKSTQGVSTILIVLLCLSYALWTLYGFLKQDWFLIIGHGMGILTTGIIIYQIISYRKKNSKL